MKTYFPSPIEHAAVLIDACGSLESAQEVAAFNCEFAPTDKEYRYWNFVRHALSSEAGCLAN